MELKVQCCHYPGKISGSWFLPQATGLAFNRDQLILLGLFFILQLFRI